jgi:hypothetical protein
VPGLKHQYPVPRGESVYDRGFPGAGAGGRIDDHRASGLKNGAQILQDFGAQPRKLLAAVIDDGTMHRTQDSIGDVGGPGNLQKMAAGVYQDNRILIDCEQRSRPSIVEARVFNHAAPGVPQDQRRDHSPES